MLLYLGGVHDMTKLNKKSASIIILLLLIVGVAAWQLTKKSPNNAVTTTPPSSAPTSSSNANVFNPLATSGSSYQATITTTAAGTTSNATMAFDKNTGNVQYTGSAGGQNISIVYTKDAYYLCQTATTCIKYATGQGAASFNPASYEYTDAQLAGYRAGASYHGKQSCPAGTCDVWQVTNAGYTSSLFVDTKTKRISQVQATTAASTSKIVYSYQNVSVTVPANATTAP
jgi:hypothetical protein